MVKPSFNPNLYPIDPFYSAAMHVAQYHVPDPDKLAAVQALSDLLGLEYRISGPLIAVIAVDNEQVELLRRAVPGPVAVVDVAASLHQQLAQLERD